jgi:DnaJ-class molecular chaperone
MRRTYIELAKRYHPDTAQGVQQVEEFTSKFKKINAAWESKDFEALNRYANDDFEPPKVRPPVRGGITGFRPRSSTTFHFETYSCCCWSSMTWYVIP